MSYDAWLCAGRALDRMHRLAEAEPRKYSGYYRRDYSTLADWYAHVLVQPFCTAHDVRYKNRRFQWWPGTVPSLALPGASVIEDIGDIPLPEGLLGNLLAEGVLAPGRLYRGLTAEQVRLQALSMLPPEGVEFTLVGRKYLIRQGAQLGFFELEITPEPALSVVSAYAELLLHMPHVSVFLEDYDVAPLTSPPRGLADRPA